MPDELRHVGGPNSSRRWWFGCLLLSGLVPVALLIDIPVARQFADRDLPGDINRLFIFAEVFAHGLGVLMIGITAWVLAPRCRRSLARVAVLSFGAGLLATLPKMLVARVRPHVFLEDLPSSAKETFVGWIPSQYVGSFASQVDHLESFPSGHTAAACGLAIGLSRTFPRGRWWFLTLAVLSMSQRVVHRQHYVSDTLAGAAIALALAAIVLSPRGIGAWFDRFEGQQATGDAPEIIEIPEGAGYIRSTAEERRRRRALRQAQRQAIRQAHRQAAAFEEERRRA